MRLIGVIDLKQGQAVHARGGRRGAYAPVSEAAGTLIAGNAVNLARLYRDTFRLQEVYIADLDAIETAAPTQDAAGHIEALGVDVWLDAGVRTIADMSRVAVSATGTMVIGLETLESLDVVGEITRNGTGHPVAFSLDLRDRRPINATAVIAGQSPEQIVRSVIAVGVSTVIVLDLARVGRAAGPDFELLRAVRHAVPAASVFAGGGIRDLTDLRQLADVGCDGALVATAVHNGRLTPGDIAAARRL